MESSRTRQKRSRRGLLSILTGKLFPWPLPLIEQKCPQWRARGKSALLAFGIRLGAAGRRLALGRSLIGGPVVAVRGPRKLIHSIGSGLIGFIAELGLCDAEVGTNFIFSQLARRRDDIR